MIPQHPPARLCDVLAAHLACPRCGAVDRPTIGPGLGPHAFRAVCRHCGSFIRWVSKYSPQELKARRAAARAAAMARRPPSQAQLNYLQTLGDTAPPPTTMSEASRRIDDLLERYKS